MLKIYHMLYIYYMNIFYLECKDPPTYGCGKSICDKLKVFCDSEIAAIGGYAKHRCPISCGVKACLKRN